MSLMKKIGVGVGLSMLTTIATTDTQAGNTPTHIHHTITTQSAKSTENTECATNPQAVGDILQSDNDGYCDVDRLPPKLKKWIIPFSKDTTNIDEEDLENIKELMEYHQKRVSNTRKDMGNFYDCLNNSRNPVTITVLQNNVSVCVFAIATSAVTVNDKDTAKSIMIEAVSSGISSTDGIIHVRIYNQTIVPPSVDDNYKNAYTSKDFGTYYAEKAGLEMTGDKFTTGATGQYTTNDDENTYNLFRGITSNDAVKDIMSNEAVMLDLDENEDKDYYNFYSLLLEGANYSGKIKKSTLDKVLEQLNGLPNNDAETIYANVNINGTPYAVSLLSGSGSLNGYTILRIKTGGDNGKTFGIAYNHSTGEILEYPHTPIVFAKE